MSDYLDRYGRRQSICHRMPAIAKLLLTLVVVGIAVSIPIDYWPVQGVLGCVILLGHTLARIPISYVVRRLAIFLPMLFVLSLSLPMSQGFQTGWDLMLSILFRSTLSFLAAIWLINVMLFDQLLITLRRLWVPEVVIAILAFMYRYIFVLWDELEKMRKAREARSIGTSSLRVRWKIAAQIVGMLLIRAMSRAERVHGAMCARGWDGHVRTLDP